MEADLKQLLVLLLARLDDFDRRIAAVERLTDAKVTDEYLRRRAARVAGEEHRDR